VFVEYYLATEIKTGATVQLRTPTELASRELRFKKMFLLEAYAAATLRHLNILSCSKPDEVGGVLFSTTEYKPDTKRLRDLISCAGWLDLEQTVSIADQISSALAYAHSRGVVHLRLRPENILVESDGWVAVTDFGLAAGREIAEAHRQRSFRQATAYLSPEQAVGERVDRRSDLYSLGVIVYEMLTDRVPFMSGDERTMNRIRLNRDATPPHLQTSRVPEPISSVVMGLLERSPQRRFSDAATFQAALLGACIDDPELGEEWTTHEPDRVEQSGWVC